MKDRPGIVARWLPSLAMSCALAASAAGRPVPALKAGTFDPPRAAPELGLESSNGGRLSLADYRGKVVLLEFGFTSCPNVCPTTLAVLAQAHKRLGADAKRVQLVFVTVDPQRDDAKRMKVYLQAFEPSFVGGTGTAAQLAKVRDAYGVLVQRKAVGKDYTLGHSSSVCLIDRKGRLRAMMPFGASAADYVHDLRVLLGE